MTNELTKALAIVVDCGGVYDRVKKSFVVYWFYSSLQDLGCMVEQSLE